MKKLFKNCSVLLRKGKWDYEVLNDACLGIDGDTICFIGKEKEVFDKGAACAKDAGDSSCLSFYGEVIDAEGALLMPGLVNAHGHAAMTLLRCVGGGLPLQRWLNEEIFPVEAVLTGQDVAAGTSLATLEMLACGTTFFSEMYDFPWEDGEAIKKSGMKANLSRVGLCFDPETDMKDWPRASECAEFVDSFSDPSGRVRPEFCFHSEYLTTEKFVEHMTDEIKARPGVTLNVHISETALEHEECISRHGLTPIEYFDRFGLVGPGFTAAHCVWVSDGDLEIMRDRGASLVHNPSSNMKLGSGFAPIAQALEMGVNVALGTDGTASNDNLDMFEEMHVAALIHKGEENEPTLLTAGQVLDMATVNGARALGRPDTGELAVGKKADIIAVDLGKPHMRGPWNGDGSPLPIEALVYSAQGSDVVMTMVDGEILYDHGRYTRVDRDAVYREFDEALRGISRRMKEKKG